MGDRSEFKVRIVLKGSAKQTCISPSAYPKDEAERTIAEIDQARREGTAISLSWLSVDGGDVLAANLEEVSGSAQRSTEEILAALKARGMEVVPSSEDERAV